MIKIEKAFTGSEDVAFSMKMKQIQERYVNVFIKLYFRFLLLLFIRLFTFSIRGRENKYVTNYSKKKKTLQSLLML